MKLPSNIGPIHFVGIGGIGMSGIAEVLANLGYTVTARTSPTAPTSSGCATRASRSPSATRPKTSTAPTWWWSRPRSSATIRNWSPRALKRLPVVRRAEMLAELMRLKSCVAIAGTHGKTTTTSMVAALLDAGGLDPTVINGGIINAYGTNARLGAGDWMVVEADESDGTFLEIAGRRRHRHQYRSRASRSLPHLRRGAGSVPRFRREHSVLRLCGDVHRPSGGADAGRQARRPPHSHVRRKPAGRRAPCRPQSSRWRSRTSRCCSATARARPRM